MQAQSVQRRCTSNAGRRSGPRRIGRSTANNQKQNCCEFPLLEIIRRVRTFAKKVDNSGINPKYDWTIHSIQFLFQAGSNE